MYVTLHLDADDPRWASKELMIGLYNGSYIRVCKYFERYAEHLKPNTKFLGYLRFIVYDGDLNALCPHLIPAVSSLATCTPEKRKIKVPPLSIANETKMLEKLKVIGQACLSKYPDPYEEDLRLLEGSVPLTFNQRNCIRLRADDKKVLKPLKD